ncbi:MAG: hypothetical protein VX772_10260, partial [Bacteroidota bacterium]|nr:hypothetical protein [Bacteroidota bacterium]
YTIKAKPREELQYTYMGMDTVSIMVEDVTRILNVTMEIRIEELDEVEIISEVGRNKQRILQQQYPKNEKLIRTAYGIIDSETFPGRLPVLNSKDMISNHYHFGMYLQGKFAGMKVVINPDQTFDVYSRSMSSARGPKPAIYDIDGQIFTQGPSWLDPSTVERVALMPGLIGASKYGSIADGGVVIVNTKNGTYKQKSSTPFDQAKLRNNYVKEGEVQKSIANQTLPNYLKRLKESNSVEEAKNIYLKTRNIYGNNPYFLLDSYTYFYEIRKEVDYADEIMEEYIQVMDKNPVMLKALAYTLESEARHEKAHDIYKKVYSLRPDYAQSFIDMANSYRNLGQPKSATTLYARHAYLQDEGMLPVDSMELGMIMKREIKNLFTLENSTLKIKKRDYQDDEFATRLVFEWNDSEAEFDLQFVNPGNQYFNWKHTLAEMPERIQSEKKFGYSMADFLLDDELPGRWRVNATYHGNKQVTPTYLKVTIYRNYGSKLQSKETKVYRLGPKGANQYLFDFNLSSNVANN